MSNFEADDSDAFKGQGCGALPFAGWEDPPLPLAALHHLHQVGHSCCFCCSSLVKTGASGDEVLARWATSATAAAVSVMS